MSERDDGSEVGIAIICALIITAAAVGLVALGIRTANAFIVALPLAKAAWETKELIKLDKSKSKAHTKKITVKLNKNPIDLEKKFKAISAPIIGLGLGFITNTMAIGTAVAVAPALGPIVGGIVGTTVGVAADFIPHCVQEFYHCVVNKDWPKAKTRIGRIAEFFRGPILGCGISFLTNGLAIASARILTNSLGRLAGNTIGALVGVVTDAIPHGLQELRAQRKMKESNSAKLSESKKSPECIPKNKHPLQVKHYRKALNEIIKRPRNKITYTPDIRGNGRSR